MKAKPSKPLGPPVSGRAPRTASPDAGKHDLKLARHQAQCRICRHPQREALEQDYLDWVGPRELAQTYKLASERAIYRHAHALALIEPRRANRLGALDRIIQHVGKVKPTAGAIISAIRLSAQLAREAAAASDSPRQGIVLAFTGMPESDAVRPRQDAEKQNRLSSGESAPPEDGSPRNNASSRKRPSLPARAGRDRKGAEEPEPAPPAAARPSRDRKGAEGLGHSPYADSHPGKRQQAAVAIPTAPPGTPNPGGLW